MSYSGHGSSNYLAPRLWLLHRHNRYPPNSYHLLGFYFDGHYFFDKAMPMGLSISCQIFETFSIALQWTAQKQLLIGDMLNILGDFLFILILTFSRRLMDLTKGISSPHHHIRYKADRRPDLLTASLFESYKGRAMLLDDDCENSDIINLFSDAFHIDF